MILSGAPIPLRFTRQYPNWPYGLHWSPGHCTYHFWNDNRRVFQLKLMITIRPLILFGRYMYVRTMFLYLTQDFDYDLHRSFLFFWCTLLRKPNLYLSLIRSGVFDRYHVQGNFICTHTNPASGSSWEYRLYEFSWWVIWWYSFHSPFPANGHGTDYRQSWYFFFCILLNAGIYGGDCRPGRSNF